MPIQCLVCGEWLRAVMHKHLKKHNLTTAEYKALFPNTPLVCDETLKLLQLAQENLWSNKTRTDVLRQKLARNLKGKTYEEIHGVEGAAKLKATRRKSKFWDIPLTDRVAMSKATRKKTQQRYDNDPIFRAEYTARMSASIKKCWEDPDFIYSHTRNIRPNKPETALRDLLNKLMPSTFGYNGDYSLGISLGRRIPDFVNINGKKQVIELFGDYWHRNDNPDDKIKHFQQFGFDCLIVWERELKDESKLTKKLLLFGR